ncbi:MAG: DUF929 family protein [Gammaproteobacteria bacterium]
MNRVLTLAPVALSLALLAFAGPASAAGKTPPKLEKMLHKPVPSSLMATLGKASMEGLGIGSAPEKLRIKPVDGPRLAIKDKDKVGLFYMGANFCPYCAGQRWALILTLLRFGKFEGLHYMLSSPKDAYANTPTFTFEKAHYISDHLILQAVETSDRNGGQLQKPSKLQTKIAAKFDAPPYTPTLGGIPFIYIDGQYMVATPLLLPGELSGKNWQEAANELANPQSTLFQSVMPRVNVLTAAICRLDGGNPDKVCSAPGVIAANGALLRLAANGNGS